MDSLSSHDLTPQERKRAYNRAYYQSRHDEIRKQQQSYRESHSDEIKTYGEQWRLSHREYNREQAKLYRQVDGEKIEARRRARYHANPAPAKSAALDYHHSHKPHVHARQHAYRQAHPEELRERDRQYRQTHPEKIRTMFKGIKARRRTRLTRAGGSYSIAEWETLKVKYNFTCLCCGRREPEIKLTADHVVPVVKQGSSSISNIQPLCGSCNSRKHNKMIDYRLRFDRE